MKAKSSTATDNQVTPRPRQIYAAASRLFVEKGFAATSMSDIAQAVKITKAGLYHFVASKEELLFTIMMYGMDELFKDVVEPARKVEDPLARLKLILRNHMLNIGRVETKAGNPFTIVVDEPAGLSPSRRRTIDARRREYFNFVRDTLKSLKREGRLAQNINLTVATFSLLAMVIWTARWRKPDGPLSLGEIIDQIIQIALTGVLKR